MKNKPVNLANQTYKLLLFHGDFFGNRKDNKCSNEPSSPVYVFLPCWSFVVLHQNLKSAVV